MRFVLSLGLTALLSSAALAAPWDSVALVDEQNRVPRTSRPVNIQHGGSSNKLQTIKGLDLNIAISGLGEISALAIRAEDGTLFTADARSGRLWAMTDRGQDGKFDMRRPLPYHFDTPTGLALIGTTLYVADLKAVWEISDGQPPRELASLQHADSTGQPHILIPAPNENALILGLTTKRGNNRIIRLDATTGEASLIDETQGRLHALSLRAGSEIWAASHTKLNALKKSGLVFQNGQSITSLALPGQYETPAAWPGKLRDHIIAAQRGPDAMRLIAVPTEFGQVSDHPRVLVDGFLTHSGHSAWGEPGAIAMDRRGLFFADKENGTIWRLSPQAEPQAKITIIDTASLPELIRTKPELARKDDFRIESSIQGVQIDTSSAIIRPSSIEYGSKLIKDYDEKKALEEAEKESDKPQESRRMSRKRKQPEE